MLQAKRPLPTTKPMLNSVWFSIYRAHSLIIFAILLAYPREADGSKDDEIFKHLATHLVDMQSSIQPANKVRKAYEIMPTMIYNNPI